MDLSYGQLEAALMMHFRIHPDRASAFRARIKQLAQRYQFPPGSNVGRGERMRYSTTHLFQLVAAFELINVGLPAGAVAELVESKWWNFACGFGLAIHHRRRAEHDKIVYIRVMNSALVELQGKRERAKIPSVFVEDPQSLEAIFKRNDDRVANSYVVMCASDILLSVMDGVRRGAQVEDPAEDKDFGGWHIREGYPNDGWMRAEDGWYLNPTPPGPPPPYTAYIIWTLEHKQPDLAEKLIENGPYGLAVTQEQFEFLNGNGLIDPTSNEKYISPTPKGRSVWQHLLRGSGKEKSDGLDT